jgi:chaperonin cofactor prefoldin
MPNETVGLSTDNLKQRAEFWEKQFKWLEEESKKKMATLNRIEKEWREGSESSLNYVLWTIFN